MSDAHPLSAGALHLLQQLLELDQGDGVVVERDTDVSLDLIQQLERAFCVERHPLSGGRGGMHLILRHRHARTCIEAARQPV